MDKLDKNVGKKGGFRSGSQDDEEKKGSTNRTAGSKMELEIGIQEMKESRLPKIQFPLSGQINTLEHIKKYGPKVIISNKKMIF